MEILTTPDRHFEGLPDHEHEAVGGERVFESKVPGAAGQPHRTIENAGHLLQVDAGPLLVDTIAAWMR